jgi:hypothetical protein
MKYAARLAMFLLAGLGALAAPQVAAGQGSHGGGGHSSGGHSGGYSAHASSSSKSSGHASGTVAGHSIGHSIAHFFGWHAKSAASQPPTMTKALMDRKMAPQSDPDTIPPRTLHPPHHRVGQFFIGQSFLLRHRGIFGYIQCPDFGFPSATHFPWNDFNCFDNGFFFFDPFFSAFSSFGWFELTDWSRSGLIAPMEAPLPASPVQSESAYTDRPDTEEGKQAKDNEKRDSPVTLLQLRDGSLYGLTEYWVTAGELHYVTTYGGESSVPLERIDLEKTLKLNEDRGIHFVLTPKLDAAPG